MCVREREKVSEIHSIEKYGVAYLHKRANVEGSDGLLLALWEDFYDTSCFFLHPMFEFMGGFEQFDRETDW